MSNIQLLRASLLAAFAILVAAMLSPERANAQFICVGNATGATVPPGTASGAGASATGGTDNVACGTDANATGNNGGNTSVGKTSSAAGDNSFNTAMGNFANGGGSFSNNTAIGGIANAGGNNSENVALGGRSFAFGNNSNNIAIGSAASATGNGTNNTAVGANSVASGANSTALGGGASAAFDNSAAFGTGATATRANQQAFGTTGNTYTMSGITSAASRAAQTGPVQVVTSDGGGNLATSSLAGLGIASTADIAGINARLNDLTNQSNKATTGVAMAFAMAGVPSLMPSETFAVTMNWGNFQSANGLALNAAARVSNNVQVNAGLGYGANQNLVGGRVGLRVGW
jgi:trimeric autotransporter adhesin